MLDLNEMLLDQWIEYSGGLRPGANMLRFEGGEHPQLIIRYVFDWETEDIVTLSFDLELGDFDKLVSGVMSKGYSSLSKESQSQKLFFEWKLSEDRIMIRLDGQAFSGTEGKVRYLLSEFRDLIETQA